MKKVFLPAVALLGVMALSACETVEGAGRDMQNAGQAIEGEAQQTQAEQRAQTPPPQM